MGGATARVCKAVVESVSVSAPSVECMRVRDSSEGCMMGVRERDMPRGGASSATSRVEYFDLGDV